MIKGIISDLHCHAWSLFHVINKDGVNSRLQTILHEIARAGQTVLDKGGQHLFVAGDLFHVRGSIAPSVLNPTTDLFANLISFGLKIIIIPGNHDLEGKKTRRISSAVTSLERVGCIVADKPYYEKETKTLVVPWIEDIVELKNTLKDLAKSTEYDASEMDLIIHAPVDGVIIGLPAHGLTADWLSKLGFKRVFSGHYHNHVDFTNGVYSIGAIAHHTWSDPGSKAGFLMVDDKAVTYLKSHAPEFVDVDASMDELEIAMAVDKNYVRAKINKASTEDVNKLREFLTKSGALGVVINAVRAPTKVRAGAIASVKAGKSMEASIGEYIEKNDDYDADMKAMVTGDALKVLSETV